MESVERTLRQVLGRTRYGLYALDPDGSRPRLLSASPQWPPSHADPARLLEENPWLEGAAYGRPTRLADLRGSGRRPAGLADLAVLPVGGEERRRGGLVMQAGARSALWDWSEEDWTALAHLLDAYLQREEMRRSFDALRGFHDVLLDSLPLGVFAIDAIGRVTFLSRPAEAILGYSRPEALGVDCARIFHPAGGVETNPLLLGLRGKETRVELYITDREGNEKPVWIQMTRIPGPPPETIRGLLVLIRDTTEERAYEEDRRRRERLASIGELSAGVAHEIRNPLTGIGNCAQVLRDRLPADEPLHKMVAIILDEVTRLNRIVESLLTFARPGRPQLRESPLMDTVRRVVELEQGKLTQSGITVQIRARGRIPPIFIDPDQIAQVLLNIVRNAGEAMIEGGRLTIEISVVRRRPHLRRGTGQRSTDRIRYDRDAPLRRYVRVQVTDTGEGIPKEAASRVFDPFFTTRPKGTGLGLSISQSIITEHGGFISLRSIEKKGTAITVDLPVERRQGERRKRAG